MSAKRAESKEKVLLKAELSTKNKGQTSELNDSKLSNKSNNESQKSLTFTELEGKVKSGSKTPTSARSSLSSASTSSLKSNKKNEISPRKDNKLSDLSRTDFSGK